MSTTTKAASRDTAPWVLVMRREIMAKATDKGFLISTLVTVCLIAAYLGFVAWDAQRSDEVRVTAIGQDVEMARAISAAADSDTVIEIAEVGSDAEAREQLAKERTDAWLQHTDKGWVLTYQDDEDSSFSQLVERVVAEQTIAVNAQAAGTDLASLQKGSQLSVSLVSGDAEAANVAQIVGFAFAFLFYLASIMFGMQLASSVVEEKQSRIVEIIAAAIPLRQLLIGKILGNTVLALAQVLLYALVGLVGLSFTNFSSYVPSLSGPVLWFVLFFAAGFVALSCLWAVAGSLASRNEDLQATTTPLTMVLVLVFIVALSVDGAVERWLSFVPPFSAILMPKRLLTDDPALWQPVLAVALLLAAAGALVMLGERLYQRALLQTSGRVSLKSAWNGEV